ncbi:hypothetical protein [Micromonospora sp. WMMC250]|uniref:hypothetical protein n=1 Tax=Micromonospora sp. WMMC250 TaxID=3014781 RepID=UPI0022B6EDE4|nr:hypothetical protein [Micromonospora sp. WMMC250]MCZ7376570.1 hypothetical protein [Micromonospora sp. WMMC250]
MEHTWGPQTADPPRRHTEYGYLILAVAAIVFATALFLVDHLTPVNFPFGTYPLLTGLFAVGGCGWVVRSSDAQRQELADRLARVEQMLAEQCDSRPPRRVAVHRSNGQTYASRSAQGDTIGFTRQIDADTVGGLQVANQRQRLSADTDPTTAARVEGYVEGYADGVTRRDEGNSPN